VVKQEQTRKIVIAGLVLNVLLCITKAWTGYAGTSEALIADAMESAGDVFGALLILFALRYALQPPDSNHPYGHGKAEPLFTFAVVALLIGGVVVIGYRSVQNILTPHAVPKAFTLWTLGITIAAKEIFFRIVAKLSKETGSSLLKSDAWHHRSDAITSLAAFVGVVIAIWSGYAAADDWAALVACAFILYTAYSLFRPALGEVMDEHQYDELVEEIRITTLSVEGVTGTEKCFVRKSGVFYFVDFHINVEPEITVREGHEIAHRVEEKLRSAHPNMRMIIHVEPHEPSHV
jgi:cation diffusion facilitator family transporter